MPTIKASERLEALEYLRKVCPPGTKVYTVLRDVARSGMSRRIDLYVIRDNEPVWITFSVATVLGWTFPNNGQGLRVDGCGMDAGFHTVHSLSYALHPDGFTCTGDHCPSNEHSNGDRDYTPHQHATAGYSLRHNWL